MLKQWLARATVGRIAVGATLEPSDQPDAGFEATWRRVVAAMRTVDAGFRDPSGNGWKLIQARR